MINSEHIPVLLRHKPESVKSEIRKSVSSPHLRIYDHHVGDFPSSEQLPGGRRQLHGLPEGWDSCMAFLRGGTAAWPS